MEIIKINCEKVKISLSNIDMENLHINCDMLDCGNKTGRQAFNKILDETKEKTGFSTDGKRIFVQLFPSKDGGCDIFITRLNDSTEKKYAVNRKNKNICYLFENMNELIGFCKTIKKMSYEDASPLYIDESRKKYYICLEREFPFAEEYYGRKCSGNSDVYIKEHHRLVTDNAVTHLSGL